MSSPPKPWQVNPEGAATATTGDGSPAPVTDAAGANVGGGAGGAAGGVSGVNSTATGAGTGSYLNNNRTGMYSGGMGSSYGIGGLGMGGGYGGMGLGGYGMGGMYGGMGGMGGMGMMGPSEQKGQMAMFLISRLGEMVSGFAQMLQSAMNTILNCVSNLAGLHSQYYSVPPALPSNNGQPADKNNLAGIDLNNPDASSAMLQNVPDASSQQAFAQQGEDFGFPLWGVVKKMLLLYVVWKVARYLSVRLDNILNKAPPPAYHPQQIAYLPPPRPN
ncbi:hypothetical protein DIPPA_12263 [Diplonema papillatum]|nr:hypothetical protein DIPPA_12263 [Diplonema papillatum]